MSSFFGDLIVPDIPPLEATERYTAAELGDALSRISELTEYIGLSELWSRAELVGTDGTSIPPGPARGRLGVSMAHACTVGIGFWRDYYLPERMPESEQRHSGYESSTQSEIARLRAERWRAEAAIRKPEVDAIQRLAQAASGCCHFPLRADIGVCGSIDYAFDVGYRRRLAYILGFEESLSRESLAPAKALLESLIAGSLGELVTLCPPIEARSSFSVFLNLAATLNRAIAYQRAKQVAHPDLPGPVREGKVKLSFLAKQLQDAATKRVTNLNHDGRIAIHALQKELEQVCKQQLYYSPAPIDWGKVAASSVYTVSE